MKRTEKEFRKYVREMRKICAGRDGDRVIKIYGENSKRGQALIEWGSQYEGYDLNQVYDFYSEEKKRAYDDVYNWYMQSRHGEAFGICSHNIRNFTVSWLCDDGLWIVTKKTAYLVIFNE